MANCSLFDRHRQTEHGGSKMPLKGLQALPEEVLEAIFECLDQRDRLAVRLVCRQFRRIANRGALDFLHRDAPEALLRHPDFSTTTGAALHRGLAVFFTEKDAAVSKTPDVTWENIRDLEVALCDGTRILSRRVKPPFCSLGNCALSVLFNSECLFVTARREFPIDPESPARNLVTPLAESKCTIGWRKYAFYHGTCEIFRITAGSITQLGPLMFGTERIVPTRSASNSNVLAFIKSSMERDLLVYGEDKEREEIVQLRCFKNGDSHRFWVAADSTDAVHATDSDHHLEFWAMNGDGTEAVAAVPESRLR